MLTVFDDSENNTGAIRYRLFRLTNHSSALSGAGFWQQKKIWVRKV